MSSPVMWVVVALFLLQCTEGTFPPVSEPPPIPPRPLDNPGTRYYIQEDPLPHPNVIKQEPFYSVPLDTKDEPRWYPENDPADNSDSTERFERYFADGQPAIGPVATPLPDETYVAQPSLAKKGVPELPQNVGPSDLWLLTKGPNDQYVQERWVQVPIPQDRFVEVVNPEVSPKGQETIKSFPPPPTGPIAVKMSGPPPPGAVAQQMWVRAPIQVQKGSPIAPVVEEVPSVKRVVDVPPPSFQQPQIFKGQPLITPYQGSVQKSSFPVPPPPQTQIKSIDAVSPKQSVFSNQPLGQLSEPVVVEKGGVLQQVKHIWVPTSHQTGKFITVPVGDSGKSIQSKGMPLDIQPPVSVSDTWVLKQDGELPRFEKQVNVGPPIVQKGGVIVDSNPVIQVDSPKNPGSPIFGKSVDYMQPQIDAWPTKSEFPIQNVKTVGKGSPFSPQPIPSPFPVKSDAVVASKSGQVQPPPQKSFITKSMEPQIPIFQQPVVVKNGKPCPVPHPKTIAIPPQPLVPTKSIGSPKNVPLPAYRTVAMNRPPFARIVRVNRYPYGSYYVLNPRLGTSVYPYPRAQGQIIQQARNGVVRIVPARQMSMPLSPKRIVTVPNKAVALPVPNGKSAVPIMQPQILFPPVNRMRYSYPWGSYIRPFPITGRNVFVLPSIKSRLKSEPLKSSSSESSSSESSSSESKSESKKPKPKPKKKKPKKVSVESSESISSAETQDVSAPATESTPDSSDSMGQTPTDTNTDASPESAAASTETSEEPVAEESQLKPQVVNSFTGEFNQEKLQVAGKPLLIPYDEKREGDSPHSRIMGTYSLYDHRDGTLKNYAYISDADGYRSHSVSIPRKSQYENVFNVQPIGPESSTLITKTPEIETAIPQENLTSDPLD